MQAIWSDEGKLARWLEVELAARILAQGGGYPDAPDRPQAELY